MSQPSTTYTLQVTIKHALGAAPSASLLESLAERCLETAMHEFAGVYRVTVCTIGDPANDGDMTRTNEAKERCGYQEKPVQQTCANCAGFASDMVVPAWAMKPGRESDLAKFESGVYSKDEKRLRCTVYGFATKKGATCKQWRSKQAGPIEGLVQVQVITRHPENYILANRKDGTRWVIRDGAWEACPAEIET